MTEEEKSWFWKNLKCRFREVVLFADSPFWALHLISLHRSSMAETGNSDLPQQTGSQLERRDLRANLLKELIKTDSRCGWTEGRNVEPHGSALGQTAVGMLAGCRPGLPGVWQQSLFFPVICQKWAHCFVNLLSLPIFADALSSSYSVWPGCFVFVFLFQGTSFFNLLTFISYTETKSFHFHGLSFLIYKMGVEEGCLFQSGLCPESKKYRLRRYDFPGFFPHTFINTTRIYVPHTQSLSLPLYFSFSLHNNPMG